MRSKWFIILTAVGLLFFWPGVLVDKMAIKLGYGKDEYTNWPCVFVHSLLFFYIPLAIVLEEIYLR